MARSVALSLLALTTTAFATETVAVCGDIDADATWALGPVYVMTCQTFVKTGTTLTIEAGVTIYVAPTDESGKAPALVVEKGGAIMAAGSAAKPITFTALNPEDSGSTTALTDSSAFAGSITLETRGKWGGLILLGNAPTSASSNKEIEGISGKTYGGTDPSDNSGTLQYVRVWHGGAIVGADNEINGITFGGVGSGTTVDHCEVAFNADDGFEFFGGTVNVKYLSVLFVGDDAFDTDEGYQGKGQFLFVMIGAAGNHGTEMDSKTNGDLDSTPRSHPAFYSMTIIGGGAGGRTGGLMRLREGTGGKFGNVVLAYPTDIGVKNDDCGSESRTQTLPAASTDIDTYLYFSSNNIISGATTAFSYGTGCSDVGFAAKITAPGFKSIGGQHDLDYTTMSKTFSPLPKSSSAAMCDSVDSAPNSDSFYDGVTCKGAFASPSDNWLAGYSWLACNDKLSGGSCIPSPPSPPPLPPPPPLAGIPSTWVINCDLVGAALAEKCASDDARAKVRLYGHKYVDFLDYTGLCKCP